MTISAVISNSLNLICNSLLSETQMPGFRRATDKNSPQRKSTQICIINSLMESTPLWEPRWGCSASWGTTISLLNRRPDNKMITTISWLKHLSSSNSWKSLNYSLTSSSIKPRQVWEIFHSPSSTQLFGSLSVYRDSLSPKISKKNYLLAWFMSFSSI